MLEEIDLHDGSIDEWYKVGEPSMTLLDFKTFSDRPHDPSNLDFRVWLAWHDEPDRVYAAFIIADDVYPKTATIIPKAGCTTMTALCSRSMPITVEGRERGSGFSPTREQLMEV